MKTFILKATQQQVEKQVEKCLENACAYHATGNYKLMYQYRGEAFAWLEFLEDNDIWYDEGTTINEHVQEMLDLLDEESRNLKIERI